MDFTSKPASIKIQFLFNVIYLILLVFLDTLLGSVLHPSFSCRHIAARSAHIILLRKKKWEVEMEGPTSSRSEDSEKVCLSLRSGFDWYLVGESQRIDFVRERMHSIRDLNGIQCLKRAETIRKCQSTRRLCFPAGVSELTKWSGPEEVSRLVRRWLKQMTITHKSILGCRCLAVVWKDWISFYIS
jgi:hypothetical protein